MNLGGFRSLKHMCVKKIKPFKVLLFILLIGLSVPTMADNNILKFATQTGLLDGPTPGGTRSNGTRLVLWDTLSATDTDYAIGLDGNGTNGQWYSVPTTSAAYAHIFYAGTTEIMRIKGDGTLGIGNANPSYGLDVISDTNPSILIGTSSGTEGRLIFESTGYGVKRAYRNPDDVGLYGTADLYLSAAYNNGIKYTQFVLKNNGNVGIGTDTPSEKLQVSGNISANSLISEGIPQWRVVDIDTFQSSAEGWASNISPVPTKQLSAYSITMPGKYVLGKFAKNGPSSTIAYATKTFTLPGTYTEIRLKFKLYLLDSWDIEFFTAYLGTSATAGREIWVEKGRPGDAVYATTDAYESTLYADTVRDVYIVLPKSVLDGFSITSGTLPIYLTSNLDSVESDESWAIGEVEVSVR